MAIYRIFAWQCFCAVVIFCKLNIAGLSVARLDREVGHSPTRSRHRSGEQICISYVTEKNFSWEGADKRRSEAGRTAQLTITVGPASDRDGDFFSMRNGELLSWKNISDCCRIFLVCVSKTSNGLEIFYFAYTLWVTHKPRGKNFSFIGFFYCLAKADSLL